MLSGKLYVEKFKFMKQNLDLQPTELFDDISIVN